MTLMIIIRNDTMRYKYDMDEKMLGDNDAICGGEGDAYQVAKEDKLQSGLVPTNLCKPDSILKI